MHKKVERPSWDDYFLGLAFMVAQRSQDSNTKHGCVIVDSNRHILATGYNNFVKGIKCDDLPNTRPKPGEENDIFKNKYLHFIHSEVNALANCSISPYQTNGVTAYITGKPCINCLMTMYQFGINYIIYADTIGWTKDAEENLQWQEFVKRTCIEIRAYKPDLSWMKNVYERVESLGFVG